VIDRAASKRSRYRATHSASDWPLGVESLRRGEPGWYFVPRTWLALGGLASAALTTGGFGLWIYARYIEPRWIDWHVVTLPVPGLPSAFDGYKIVHLSDLHLGAGAALTPARLKRILQRVNRYRPDLIAITGDFASHLDSIAQTGIAQLATLRAPDGIFCVPGNHDSWSGIDSVMEAVAAAGCRWLINAHHLIQRKGAQLAIAGIDDPWDGQPDLARALYGIPPDSQVILLAHAPNVADAAIRQQIKYIHHCPPT